MADATILDGEGETGDVSAVSYFFDRAHDEFMTKLHEDFVKRYGVVSFSLAVTVSCSKFASDTLIHRSS